MNPRYTPRALSALAIPVLLVCAAQAQTPTQLDLLWAEDGKHDIVDVTLQLDGDPSRTLEATVPGSVRLDLDRARTVQVAGPLHWSPVVELSGGSTSVPVFRTVPAVGRWTSRPVLANPPESVGLTFQGADLNGLALAGQIPCTVHDDHFTCRLPATVLDLRLDIDDFAPTFFWQHDLAKVSDASTRSHHLGTVELVVGASVSGWVVGPSDAVDGLGLSLVRRSAVAGVDAGRTARPLKRFPASVDPEGFFLARGLPAGAYDLEAAQTVDGAPWVAHEPRVILDPGAHHRFAEPIVLERPVQPVAYVEPALDPHGRPWAFELLRPSTVAPNAWRAVATGRTDVGAWQGPAVTAGPYRLVLRDSEGAPWGERSVTLGPSMAPELFTVDFVRVEGRVTLAEEPVDAELWFGGRFAEVSLPGSTDEDGHFTVVLPHGGSWDVELELVAVAGGRVRVQLSDIDVVADDARVAEVVLELPNTRVFGVVIDTDHQPVQGAKVSAKTVGDDGAHASVDTHADGLFVFEGLPVGEVELRAYDPSSDSHTGRRTVALEDDAKEGPVNLTLDVAREVRVVLDHGGRAVAEALVVAEIFGPPGPPRRARRDSSTGEFGLTVPDHSTGAHVLVSVAGAGAQLAAVVWPVDETAVALTVDSAAGTLVFELPDPAQLPPEHAGAAAVAMQSLVLRHGGAEISVPTLVAHLMPRPAGPSRLALVTPLAPGSYALCLRNTAECTEGELAPHGELVLSVRHLPSFETLFQNND